MYYSIGLGDSTYPGVSQADEDSIVQMARGGWSDSEIAAATGVSVAAVQHFKSKHGVGSSGGSSGGGGFSFSDFTSGLKDIAAFAAPVAQAGLTIKAQQDALKAKQASIPSVNPLSLYRPPVTAQPVRQQQNWVLPVVGGLVALGMFGTIMYVALKK